MRRTLLACLILLAVLFPTNLQAKEENQFITVVNPVRISVYTKDLRESLRAQYSAISRYNLPATWLLTYDAIIDEGACLVINGMDENQEIGIFLEVTPSLAQAANVEYNDTGFWHHATSVFLSGYTQEERKILIDTVFSEFKEKHGFYPTSVGSWWTDSFSLNYMKQKYDITANLGVSDQFSTDGYQVWGQYWSTPFYPSKFHAGIPAVDESVKLDLVTIQWAPRDPLNGYKSSLFSTQDYFVKGVGLDIDYFEKLIKLYAGKGKNIFGQVTVGLEGDLTPDAYKGEFEKQMKLVHRLTEEGEYEATNMQQFAGWYRKAFPKLSPPHIVESEDLLNNTQEKVVWYQSQRYRLGLLHSYESGETKIIDLRTYYTELQEPYYESPNREFELSINIPSLFDETNWKEGVWKVGLGKLIDVSKEDTNLVLSFEKGKILLFPEKIIIEGETLDIPRILEENSVVDVVHTNELVEIIPRANWFSPREGILIRDLTAEATHFLAGKKVILVLSLFMVLFLSLLLAIIKRGKNLQRKIFFLTILIAPVVLLSSYWYHKNSTWYSVNQGEIDALFHLSILPRGKVVVFDNECLQCSWHTNDKPAIFANKRNYVQKYGKHPIVYNSSVFKAETRKESKEEFDKLNAKYIYLSKFEEYVEKIPFSPGDLEIEKIYDNANAEIWRVKK
jgi:hypothetical protein